MFNLQTAFRQGSVAGLHIDLQYHYLCGLKNEHVAKAMLPKLREFAQKLGVEGVPNYWIAYTSKYLMTNYASFVRTNDSYLHFDRSLSLGPWDRVFEKDDPGAFNGPSGLSDHLKSNGMNTLLITGVSYAGCVYSTIIGALREGFNVYAVMDLTDCVPEDVAQWNRNVNNYLSNKGIPNRLSFSTSNSVLSLIS